MTKFLFFLIFFNLITSPRDPFRKAQKTEADKKGVSETEPIQNSSTEDAGLKNAIQSVSVEEKDKDVAVTVASNPIKNNANFEPVSSNFGKNMDRYMGFANNMDKYMGFAKKPIKEEPKPEIKNGQGLKTTPPLINQMIAKNKLVVHSRNFFETDGSVVPKKPDRSTDKTEEQPGSDPIETLSSLRKNPGITVTSKKPFKNPYDVDNGEKEQESVEKDSTSSVVDNKTQKPVGEDETSKQTTQNKIGKQTNQKQEKTVPSPDQKQEEPAPPPPTPRPIKIVYEKSFLMDSILKTGKTYSLKVRNEYVTKIINIIEKTDSFLRNYITIITDPSEIEVPAGFDECNPGNSNSYEIDAQKFKVAKKFTGDILIFVFAIDDEDKNETASAMPCKKFDDGTAMIGRISFNIAQTLKIVNMDNLFEKTSLYQTVVHEIFHILAFHSYLLEDFYTKPLKDYPNIKKFKDNMVQNSILDNSHWSQQYLYNDLMIPSKSSGTVLSIFSLEYLELVNKEVYIINKENLQFNPVLDQIHSWRTFLTYKCDDKIPSKYENFCSKVEMEEKHWTCDRTRMHVMYCDSEISLSNNCARRLYNTHFQCANQKTVREDDDFSLYGPDSRCFGTVKKGLKIAYCLNHTIENNQLYIVGRHGKYHCSKRDQPVDVEYQDKDDGKWYIHQIMCPDPTEFMEMERKIACPDYCNFNGVCNAGVCYCFDGFDPKDNCLSPKKTKYFTTFSQSYRP